MKLSYDNTMRKYAHSYVLCSISTYLKIPVAITLIKYKKRNVRLKYIYSFPFVRTVSFYGNRELFGRGVKMGIFFRFFNFEDNFLKRVHPYGSENNFPQTTLRSLGIIECLKILNTITLL